MARQRAAEPRNEQLLIRITAPEKDVLEAASHLEGITANEYVHRLVTGHLSSVRDDRHVQADIANRMSYAAELATATPIDTGRRPSRKRSSGRGSARGGS